MFEEDRKLRMRVIMPAVALSLTLGIFPVSASFAETNTEHGATETSADVNPCTGEPGILTLTYNEIEHSSNDANEGGHFTFTQTGTFTFVPNDEGGESFSGHFTVWGGGNQNSGGTDVGTFTLSIHGTGSEGSTLRANQVSHETSNPADVITSQFDKMNCH
ncbi:MAG TPA: hypothetical protein VJP79_09435 [Nitrososphaera sp.]|nr:hypothetical protein [Nitrososphaera sp.]